MPELDAIAMYNRMAQRARKDGSPEQALLHLSDALRLARECRRPLLEARSRHSMGLVYAQTGRNEQAASCWRCALGLANAARTGGGKRLAAAISANLAAYAHG
jgi:hypothetical protein